MSYRYIGTREPVLARTAYKPAWSKVRLVVKAEGGLHFIRGNQLPHFTLTKDAYRLGFPNQCQSGGCDHETILKIWPRFSDLAALHLSDINGVPMHAESNGWYWLAGALPQNAGERYHGGNSKQNLPKPEGAPRRGDWDTTDHREPTPDECLQFFADHVRVDIETARRLRDTVESIWRQTRTLCESNPLAAQVDASDWPEWTYADWTKASWAKARESFAAWIEDQKPRWKAEADACIAKHGLAVFGDKWEGAAE